MGNQELLEEAVEHATRREEAGEVLGRHVLSARSNEGVSAPDGLDTEVGDLGTQLHIDSFARLPDLGRLLLALLPKLLRLLLALLPPLLLLLLAREPPLLRLLLSLLLEL